jgi:hypothetical protein
MAYDEKYCSPDSMPDHAGGKPALQEYSEAMERCEQRRRWREAHPGEYKDDWEQASRDYETIEHAQDLTGGMTFEPGDAFVPNRGK